MTDHDEIEMLLPWYVTGTLDTDEIARVDAHLAGCADCRGLLAEEQALRTEVAELPVAIPAFGRPVMPAPARPSFARRGWTATRRTLSQWSAKPKRVAAFAAAQAAVVLVTLQLAQSPVQLANSSLQPEAEYRTLSSGEAPTAANIVIMFRPETREGDMRALLGQMKAKIVDGPTDSNAYMLQVPEKKRDGVLSMLQKSSMVTLAQPIDGGKRP